MLCKISQHVVAWHPKVIPEQESACLPTPKPLVLAKDKAGGVHVHPACWPIQVDLPPFCFQRGDCWIKQCLLFSENHSQSFLSIRIQDKSEEELIADNPSPDWHEVVSKENALEEGRHSVDVFHPTVSSQPEDFDRSTARDNVS